MNHNHEQNLNSQVPLTTPREGGLHLSDIRPSRLVYFLAYSLELMLFAARGQFLTMGASLFGIGGWTVANVFHMAASLVFMLLWKEKFKGLLRTSVAIMVVGFIPFLFMPLGVPRLIFGIIFYIGLGGAVTGARCGFAFACNNAERLAGMIIMFFSVALMRFVRSLGAEGFVVELILPLALLLGLCYCLLSFREEDFTVRQEPTSADRKGFYWAFAFFALYFAFDGYNSALVHGYKNPDFLFFFIGMVISGLILFIGIGKLRLNTWHIWNIFFAVSICMGLFATFAPQLGTEKPQYLFGGLSMIGWPLCIYTLGCAQRKFASYKLLKQCTLVYVLLSPLITLSSDLVEEKLPHTLPLVSFLFILVFAVAFLMLSPISYRHLFSAAWAPELHSSDMQNDTPEEKTQTDPLNGHGLTPRQKEIAALLLAAKTTRQISAELHLSESTVKMHVSDLYRKLGISSKAELFLLFGLMNNSRR